MNKRLITILIMIIIIGIFFISCHTEANNNQKNNQNNTDENNSEETMDAGNSSYENLIEPNRTFSGNMLKMLTDSEINNESINKNVFFSPLSISIALTMTYNGAKGDTLTSMASTLEYAGMDVETVNKSYLTLLNMIEDKGEGVELAIANALFGRQEISFKEEFINTIKKYYDGDFQALDFSNSDAVKTINDWVKDNTRDKIKKIIKQIPADAILYLINAIYFNGNWKTSFDKDKTTEYMFNLQDGNEKKVNMMWSEGDYLYKKEVNYKAVGIPYGDKEEVSMYVFVPNEGVSIIDFLDYFNKDNLEGTLLDFYPANLDFLGLPKFKIEYEKTLVDILSNMGMEIAFSPSADLTGIADMQDLAITNVIHKAYVDVNEEGTEAAAVTGVEVGITSVQEPVGVIAERPFVFIIKDEPTQSILFMGVVIEPKEKL